MSGPVKRSEYQFYQYEVTDDCDKTVKRLPMEEVMENPDRLLAFLTWPHYKAELVETE